MAYITASETKSIRNALKAKFGKTLKFSVRNSHHSSVNINLLESSVYNLEPNPDYDCNEGNGYGFGQVSPWMTPKDQVENLLKKINLIAETAPAKDGGKEWYDKSDTMTDYFNTAYYVFIDIGKWNKSFKFTGKK